MQNSADTKNGTEFIEENFKKTSEALESQIHGLNQEILSLQSRLESHNKRVSENKNLIESLVKENARKYQENSILEDEIRKIKIENNRLSGIKETIINALERSPKDNFKEIDNNKISFSVQKPPILSQSPIKSNNLHSSNKTQKNTQITPFTHNYSYFFT